MIDLGDLISNIEEYSDLVARGHKVNPAEDPITSYEKLLAGSIAFRSKYSNIVPTEMAPMQKVIPTIAAMISWLRNTDFYEAPASTKYHESFRGGLLRHTLNAYNSMTELINIYSFSGVNIGSATLCILAHDWCKIDRYESYLKSTPDDNGNWIKVTAYKCKDDILGLGHGPQSLMMLSRFCTSQLTSLTFDEMAAIRWHMYTYDVTSYDIYDLNNCSNKIPLVLLTQFADQLSVCQMN